MVLFPVLAEAQDAVNVTQDNVAIGGYDPVADNVVARPVRGGPSITQEWHDAIWQLSSDIWIWHGGRHEELARLQVDAVAVSGVAAGFCKSPPRRFSRRRRRSPRIVTR